MFNLKKIAQELGYDPKLEPSNNLLNSIYTKINSVTPILKEILQHTPSNQEIKEDSLDAINFNSSFYLDRFKKIDEAFIAIHNYLDNLEIEAKNKRLDLENWVLKPMKFFSALGSVLPTNEWQNFVPVTSNAFNKLIKLKRISINNRRLNEKEFVYKAKQKNDSAEIS